MEGEKIPMYKRLILGGPGAGKTTRLLEVMDEELSHGLKPHLIAFVSFTKKAVDEARRRAAIKFKLREKDFLFFRTLHSLCHRQLGIKPDQVMRAGHLREIGNLLGVPIIGKMSIDDDSGVKDGDRMLFMDNLARNVGRDLKDVYREINPNFSWPVVERFSKTLKGYKQKHGLIDFTDMLQNFVRDGGDIGVKVAIIDEAQDLTPLQWQVVDIAFAEAERLYIAGDDDQCHPAGTMILTLQGYKDIAKLNQDKDRLICYDRPEGYFTRGFTGHQEGYKFKIKKSYYVGQMIKVKVGEQELNLTPDHLCFVKWSQESMHYWCVYLMRKRKNFKLGWCKLRTGRGGFHLGTRARLEQADDAWVLKIFDNKIEASLWESYLSIKYGISTIMFKSNSGQNIYTQKNLDWAFAQINKNTNQLKRALNLLTEFKREFNFPIWQAINRGNKFGCTILDIRACNLIPELMLVPKMKSFKKVIWLKIDKLSSNLFNGNVYGLSVEICHTYVANGIATHNCIYEWSGADINRFLKLRENEREVLPYSYRLPKMIFNEAMALIKRINKRYKKKLQPRGDLGQVVRCSSLDQIDLTAPGTWLLLARNVCFLPILQEACVVQGVSYTMRGSFTSVDSDEVQVIKEYERLRKGEIMVDEVRGEEILRYLNQPRNLTQGAYRLSGLVSSDPGIWHDAMTGLTADKRAYYLTILKAGRKLTGIPKVHLDTIHGVKGGEADNVVLLTDLTRATEEHWEKNPSAENRVFYVGMTRAKQNLFLVAPTTDRGFYV